MLVEVAPGLAVRDARADDLPSIHAIYEPHVRSGIASFEEVPPDLSEIARRFAEITGQGLPYLVAEIEGTVRGYSYAGRFRPRSAYRYTVEDSIYVEEGWQRRGIGRALLSALIDRATQAGFRQMVAVTGALGESSSTRLHHRMGFRTVGLLPSVGFKNGGWVDICMMQRMLGEGDASLPLPR